MTTDELREEFEAEKAGALYLMADPASRLVSYNLWLESRCISLSSELSSVKQERDEARNRMDNMKKFYEPRMDLLQKYQRELPEPYRTAICDILANGSIRPSLKSEQPKETPKTGGGND